MGAYTSQSMRAMPGHGQQATPALFILALLSSTAFDYVWIGPVPLWLAFAALGLGAILLEYSGMAKLFRVLSHVGRPILVPWMLFIVVHSAIAIVHGLEPGGIRKSLIYSTAALLLFTMMAVWSSRARFSTVIYAIGAIALLEGVVAMAQTMGMHAAWRIPDLLSAVFPHTDPEASTLVDHIENAGRARGTMQLVHKFNAMQGLMCAILVTVTALGFHVKDAALVRRRFVTLATLLGVIGMALTFSRSTVIGLTLVIVFVTMKRGVTMRRSSAIAFALTALIIAAIIGSVVMNYDDRTASRLTSFSLASRENIERVQFVEIAWNVFKSSILIGDPALSPSGPLAMPIHSVPLRIFIDTGLVGFAFYLFVLMQLARVFWKASRSSDRYVALAGTMGVATFLMGFIDATTHSSGLLQNDFLQPAIFGMICGLISGRQTVVDVRQNADSAIRPAIPAAPVS